MGLSCCINIGCFAITVVAVLTMGLGQAMLGGLNLNACPAQPKLPALMLAAGATAALFPLSLTLIGWLFFPCGSRDQSAPSTTLRRSAQVLGIAACIAVPLATIVLNVIVWLIYEREFTVELNTEPPTCVRGVCSSPRGPNPRISLEDAQHPRYCSRQLVSAVQVTCSPVFLLLEAAFFTLPAAFVGLSRLCSRNGGYCGERDGFEKLRNREDQSVEKLQNTEEKKAALTV